MITMYFNLIAVFLLSLSFDYSQSCRFLAGKSFQITIDYGTFLARELVTFHAHRVVSIIDNTEDNFSPDNVTEPQPFTGQSGQWRCRGPNRVDIHTANYNFPVAATSTPGSMSFNRMKWIFSNQQQTIRGNYSFAYYRLGDHPTNPNVQPIENEAFGPYPITGERFKFF